MPFGYTKSKYVSYGVMVIIITSNYTGWRSFESFSFYFTVLFRYRLTISSSPEAPRFVRNNNAADGGLSFGGYFYCRSTRFLPFSDFWCHAGRSQRSNILPVARYRSAPPLQQQMCTTFSDFDTGRQRRLSSLRWIIVSI